MNPLNETTLETKTTSTVATLQSHKGNPLTSARMREASLQDLDRTLHKLKEAAIKLLQSVIPLMPLIKAPTRDMITAVIKQVPPENRKHVKVLFEKAILNIVSDAEHIRNEMDPFLTCIISNTTIPDTMFLGTVWYGDVYDAKGCVALNLLLADIVQTTTFLETKGKDYIVEAAISEGN